MNILTPPLSWYLSVWLVSVPVVGDYSGVAVCFVSGIFFAGDYGYGHQLLCFQFPDFFLMIIEMGDEKLLSVKATNTTRV